MGAVSVKGNKVPIMNHLLPNYFLLIHYHCKIVVSTKYFSFSMGYDEMKFHQINPTLSKMLGIARTLNCSIPVCKG